MTNRLSKLQTLSLTDFKTSESFPLFGDIKVSVNILCTASYINPKSPNLTHSSLSLPFFPPPFLQAHWRHDCDPVCSGMILCDVLNCCKWPVNVNNYLCELDLPIPPSSSFFFYLSLSLSPASWFSSHTVHTPPQVLASLRTVRSNFTILANVTTPTNKSVSSCQTPLPPTSTCHDSLLCLHCCLLMSPSLSLTGETFAIVINQFMIIRQCSRKFNICIVWHLSSSLCPWLCRQTIEAVNNTKIISLCNAADRRSTAWQALSATSIWQPIKSYAPQKCLHF